MVVKRSRNYHARSGKMVADKWLGLPIGPLGQIFANLNPIDMLLVVPLVCKDWGRILCGIIFSKENKNSLDFRPLRYGPFWSIFYESGNENAKATKLMNLLVGVMHAFASDGESDAGTCSIKTTSIINIVFPPGLPFYDRHLVYIAERCPELKSIILPCAENITGKGITRAMRFWTGMEEMTYGPFCYSPLYDLHLSRTIEEIGINCKSLHFLQLNWHHLHWQSAEILARNLKSLKLLCLQGGYVQKYGLQIFLSRCKKLDRVKFICSFFVKGEGCFYAKNVNIVRIQEGRRTKWGTDKYPDENGKLYTSKELVDLLWK